MPIQTVNMFDMTGQLMEPGKDPGPMILASNSVFPSVPHPLTQVALYKLKGIAFTAGASTLCLQMCRPRDTDSPEQGLRSNFPIATIQPVTSLCGSEPFGVDEILTGAFLSCLCGSERRIIRRATN